VARATASFEDIKRFGRIQLSNGMVDFYEILGVCESDADRHLVLKSVMAQVVHCCRGSKQTSILHD